ncbi:hypothetical protein CC79DRAFT_1354717 [Sarocladium strictum]
MTRPVFANDEDAVCNGKDLSSGNLSAEIEDMYCLIAVFESNKTLHEDIMTNCCLDSESVQAPPMMDDRDMLCLQACMVENGETQKSNETKVEALLDFASCVKERGDDPAYQPKNMICLNGPAPLTEEDYTADGDGDDDDDRNNNGGSNDNNNENDETEGDSEDQEDSDRSTGDTEDEDDSGNGHATDMLRGLLVFAVSVAFWQVLR